MTRFYIRNTDKGEKEDITRYLSSVLERAKALEGEKEIIFEKGEYHFYADFAPLQVIYASNTDSHKYPEKHVAIDLSGQKNLTFNGGGSEFIMHGKMTALKAECAENLTLRDFSWDFPTAATLELEVVQTGDNYTVFRMPTAAQWHIKGKNLHWYEVSPFTGKKYWHNVGHKECWSLVGYDRDSGNVARYPMTQSPFHGAKKIEALDSNTVRVTYRKSPPSLHRKGVSFEICTSAKRDCVGAFFAESKNISVENVAVRYMHGFSWLSQMCENITFKHCSFTPKAGGEKNCTSFADHLHFSGIKGKVHIEDCHFSGAHDDPINVHGTFTRVKKQKSSNTLLLEYVHRQQSCFPQYHEGDRVVFARRSNLEPFEEGRVFTVAKVVNPMEGGNGKKEMLVTFTEAIPEELGKKGVFVCDNISYTPDVYIGGCDFRHIPTRGILCTAGGKVMIENNTFDGLTMASIFISDDCNDWYESGAVKDVTIRGNTFYIRDTKGIHGEKPAVLIQPIIADRKSATGCIHKNIIVEDNTIYLGHDYAVKAGFTENLTIRRNKIMTLGAGVSVTAFAFDSCVGVRLEDNEIAEGIAFETENYMQ